MQHFQNLSLECEVSNGPITHFLVSNHCESNLTPKFYFYHYQEINIPVEHKDNPIFG
jgi:hypothetical protein